MTLKNLLSHILAIALIFSYHPGSAQAIARAESSLCHQLQLVDSFSEAYHGPTHAIDAYDSIGHYDSVFGEMLQRLTARDPASLHYPFTRLHDEGVVIATSPDGRLRIFSWDGQTGGTAHNANNVYQYLVDGKTYSTLTIVDGGPGLTYSAIYLLTKTPRQHSQLRDETFYLAVSNEITETLHLHASLEILQLADHRLRRDVPLIQTASGKTGTLGFDFVLENAKDADFFFNPATGTITFPVVLDDGQVTNKKIAYTFNGSYFVRVSN
jgi:hypothetical protein